MALPEPHPYFTVTAKDSAKQYIADIMQKLLTAWLDSDEWRDKFGFPRKGREPDDIHGRWCPRCHNSLPSDWVDPCDVCGATTWVKLDGLVSSTLFDRSKPIYKGMKRSTGK